MDSFLLAETFKYLHMIFAEKDDLPLDPDDYIFTTEAHVIPLNMVLLHGDPATTVSESQRRQRTAKWQQVKHGGGEEREALKTKFEVQLI